eukprot:CAMPEP_0201611702 /NCGR_PEP_ID=MMETSP0492-20130828/20824_1 /ASSEMBLY_ACC=CAM_ASM_000837 /TAXON_ID=420259 /ORGANISM="Thalassiosira gravida, Strain GMp14c1" /LENGTH=63 /DNA_ID=CAMNT_0048077957 /DNA_START=285 /DNA_END=476 /DNA_ORIENTATION=-
MPMALNIDRNTSNRNVPEVRRRQQRNWNRIMANNPKQSVTKLITDGSVAMIENSRAFKMYRSG